MTQQEYKQQAERSAVYPLVRDLGIADELCLCGDRPDVVVQKDGRTIGIEVVTYRFGNNAEDEDALHDVLAEYARKFDKKNDKRYIITVYFYGVEIPYGLNMKRNKRLLFKEIDNCLYDKVAARANLYIDDVELDEVPNMAESFATAPSAFIYENTDMDALYRCIADKECKLSVYKQLPKNKNIQDWWLYIYYPTVEHACYEKLVLPDSFHSDYDRIYVSEPCRYKEIYRREQTCAKGHLCHFSH